jgi:beta-carotene hydroxylase
MTDAPSRQRRLTDREQEVVRRLSGSFGWPTVLLTLVLLAVYAATVAAWAHGSLPLAAGCAISTLAAYAFYTVHHDATHAAISGRRKSVGWVDEVCGTIAGLALVLDFKGYAKNHLRHHAHTNTDRDPDLIVKGSLGQLPLKWLVGMVLVVVAAMPWGDKVVQRLVARMGIGPQGAITSDERQTTRRLRGLLRVSLLVLLAAIPLGVFWPMLLLWWLPSRFAIFLLNVFFQWLPHFPFDRTDRFGATRVNRFPGSTWLLLEQDRHLIHHLYPSIPWYRYHVAQRELADVLRDQKAVVEGRHSDPYTPIRWNVASADLATALD